MENAMTLSRQTGRKPLSIGGVVTQGFLVLWAALQIFPLYWLLGFSLKNNAEIFGENPVGLPTQFLLGNYAKALLGAKVGTFFLNSLLVTATTIVMTVLFSLMAAYAMTRMKWRLRGASMMLFMTGLMVPIHAALLPVFLIMRQMKILGTPPSLILPYTAFAIPMAILIFTGFIHSIPKELEEAACMDGCNIFRIFGLIIAPLMKPAIATVTIFTYLSAWNELMFATVFISKAQYKTLPVGIQSMAGKYSTEWGPIGAALVIATLPTLVIYLLMSGQVQKSLVAGAVKG